MEDSVKEQAPVSVVIPVPGKSKLRYPLRSATKGKEEKTPVAELSNSAASRSGRAVSSVSKSVSVLDLSKEKSSAKPPRRLSIPTKSGASATGKTLGTITPISEARSRRSTNAQLKSETPLSDVSRASSRKKFNALASASHWITQIKYSESAAKHSVSLGLFKLALEFGCEPLQRMREELKSYACRHDLSEIGETVKELFESYNITDNQEQVQVSETCSQIPDEGTRSSDDEVHSTSSMGPQKLKPRSLNADAQQVSSGTESSKKDVFHKNASATRTRATQSKSNTANARTLSNSASRKLEKKPQKPVKQEANKGKDKKKQAPKPTTDEQEGTLSPVTAAVAPEEDKENMDDPAMAEISLVEAS